MGLFQPGIACRQFASLPSSVSQAGGDPYLPWVQRVKCILRHHRGDHKHGMRHFFLSFSLFLAALRTGIAFPRVTLWRLLPQILSKSRWQSQRCPSPCSCRFLLSGEGFVLPELPVPWNCAVTWRENHEWDVIPWGFSFSCSVLGGTAAVPQEGCGPADSWRGHWASSRCHFRENFFMERIVQHWNSPFHDPMTFP